MRTMTVTRNINFNTSNGYRSCTITAKGNVVPCPCNTVDFEVDESSVKISRLDCKVTGEILYTAIYTLERLISEELMNERN